MTDPSPRYIARTRNVGIITVAAKESASEIAYRIRNGIAARPIVERSA